MHDSNTKQNNKISAQTQHKQKAPSISSQRATERKCIEGETNVQKSVVAGKLTQLVVI